ncbi:MAG: type II secretion system F family protein [Clostridia bacterium]|nr:type II secretion system F family protein [Clostridia bacterium]
MPMYKYKAISKEGPVVEGIVEAYDEFEAMGMIKQSYPIVEEIREVKSKGKSWNREIGSTKIKDKALAISCSQLSIVLAEGLPLIQSIKLIAKQTENKPLRKLLNEVTDEVASGNSLSASFEAKGADKLPVTFIETIRAGEETGNLSATFSKLQTYYEKSSKVKNKVSSAMAYPIMLAVVAVLVIIIIMVVAVPMFTSTFASMGMGLPLPTRILIVTSNIFKAYLPFMALVAGVAIFLRKLYTGTEKGKLKTSRGKLKMPVFGKTAVMKSASQFANTMGTMLASGLTITKALRATAKSMDNYYLATKLDNVVVGIEEGKSMSEGLRKCEFFSELLLEMTAVGEETGSLEGTLGVLGTFYDNEVEAASAKALALLEPLIISVLAIFVVFILLAVYLPMFSMYKGF